MKRSVAVSAMLASLTLGCAAPGGLRGGSGPIEWEIRDVGQLVSRDGQRLRWSFAIVLRENAGSTVELERVERGAYTVGMEMIGGTPTSSALVHTMAPRSELRYWTAESWGWSPTQATAHAFGGAATLSQIVVEYRFVGKDATNRAVDVPVRIRLDRSVGKPVTPPAAVGPLPSAKVLEAGDLASLAGSWAGSYRGGPEDFDVPLALTIQPDGSVEAGENDPVTRRFRVTLGIRDGRVTYASGPVSGELTLHEGEGKRVLSGRVGDSREGSPPTGYTVRLEQRSP